MGTKNRGRVIAKTLGAAMALGAAMPAAAQNFITNGGFEDGSTIDGYSTVPNSWTPNDSYPTNGYNQVESGGYARTGSYYLKIGNYDVYPTDALSQTFADVVGGLYTVNFYFFASKAGDPDAFLTVSAGGQSVTFLDNINDYALGTFTFTGTGSDTLTIAARTNPGDWYVDDVSVTGPAVTPVTGAVPEPASWAMMIAGFGMIGGGLRARRRTTPRYA